MRAEIEGFQKTSHEYERGRPGYPPDSVDWIVETAGLGPGRTVVDLAAGTGKLTVELVRCGAKVIAVEPLGEMRARLSERPADVEVREGLAEATGLPDAGTDAVTIAQAFHWFANHDALAEIHRILVPGGLMFLVWNRRDVADPVQAEISRLCAPFIGEAPSYGSGRWRDVMGKSSRFELVGEHHSKMDQEVDRVGLVARVASTSYIANLPDDSRLPLLDSVADLMGDNEVVTLPYSTATFAYKAV